MHMHLAWNMHYRLSSWLHNAKAARDQGLKGGPRSVGRRRGLWNAEPGAQAPAYEEVTAC
jgi:hypothetical protein